MTEQFFGFVAILIGIAAILLRRYIRLLDFSESNGNLDFLEKMQDAPPAPAWMQLATIAVGMVFIICGILTIVGWW